MHPGALLYVRYAFATLPTTSARDAAVALDVIAVHGHPDLADFVLTLSAATPVKDGHKPDHGKQVYVVPVLFRAFTI